VLPTDLWLGNQAILGLNVGALSAVEPTRFHAAARAVMSLVAQGAIQPDVGDVMPAAEAAEAHRRLESRAAVGTLLLQMDELREWP
jgi:NADPH2:quinone reductase